MKIGDPVTYYYHPLNQDPIDNPLYDWQLTISSHREKRGIECQPNGLSKALTSRK